MSIFLQAAVSITMLLASLGAAAQTFQLVSPDIGPGKPFADKFSFGGLGCKGANVSPALAWNDAPADTRSFALMVHDPDAPTGGAGIWHWVVLNIPADVRAIEQGAGTADGSKMPAGSLQVTNDYAGLSGSPGWGGPCPPPGQKPHNYVFTLYALAVDRIDLPRLATASHAGFLVNRATIAKATLTATYGR